MRVEVGVGKGDGVAEGVGVAAKAKGESNCMDKTSIAARQKLRSIGRRAVEAMITINAFRFKKRFSWR